MPSRALAPGSRRSALPRWLALPLALALLVTQLPAAAFADHGGREVGSILNCDRPVTPPRCTSVGDDRRHYVLFDPSLTPDLADAMRTAMDEAYSRPTKLSLVEQSRLTRWTDVVAYSADYGDNGAAAWVHCPSGAPKGENPSGDRWCRQQELVFNLNPRYGVFFDDVASRVHVACHELGHTVGLHHWGNPPETDGPVGATCMNANTPNGPMTLHPTDVDHINDYAYSLERRLPPPPVPSVDRSPVRVQSGPPVAGSLIGASEVERPRSLAELIATADAVVHGTVAGVEAGRVFGAEHHPLHYAAVTVEVHETLAGRVAGAGGRVVLEVPLLDGPDQLAALRSEMAGSERILFLRNKGTSAAMADLPLADQLAEREFHRLVTFGAELVRVDGVAVAPPDELGVLHPLHGRPFNEVVAELRRIGR